jgi:hypothetical protein
VEVNDAVSEPAFIEKFELRADVSGRACLPPPTAIGHKNRWHSSTSPAPNAWPASSAPPIVMSARRRLSSYWYNRRIYESRITEGLNVFRYQERRIRQQSLRLEHLNPQTAEFSLPAPAH